jgi:hypothetical protein
MRVRGSTLLAAAAGLVFAASAQASFTVLLEVRAENADTGALLGEVNQVVTVVDGQHEYHWSLPAPMALGSATLNGLSFDLFSDPVVGSNFNVSSGVTNTTFTINSAIVSFADIADLGRASAFIGVTDSATFGTPGQVVMTGLQPGGNAFQARYNAGNTPFSNLVGSTTFNDPSHPGFSDSLVGFSDPGNNFTPLGGFANSINSQFKFSLTSFDRASGTSTFEVIPAPGAAALLALGGLATARRRRSV